MKYQIISANGKLHLNFATIEEIAEFFETNKKTVSNWLNGKSKPKRKFYIDCIYIKNELKYNYRENVVVSES